MARVFGHEKMNGDRNHPAMVRDLNAPPLMVGTPNPGGWAFDGTHAHLWQGRDVDTPTAYDWRHLGTGARKVGPLYAPFCPRAAGDSLEWAGLGHATLGGTHGSFAGVYEDAGDGSGEDLGVMAMAMAGGQSATLDLYTSIPGGFSGWTGTNAIEVECRLAALLGSALLTVSLQPRKGDGVVATSSTKVYGAVGTDYRASPPAITASALSSAHTYTGGEVLRLGMVISLTGSGTSAIVRLGGIHLRWV